MKFQRPSWMRLALVGATVLAAALTVKEVNSFNKFVAETNSYAGIALGDNPDRVLYVLGSPTWVWDEHSKAPTDILDVSGEWTDAPKSIHVSKYGGWWYAQDPFNARLSFDTAGKLVKIMCGDVNGGFDYCEEFGGVRGGEPEISIIGRLGPPTKVVEDGATKEIFYEDLGLTIWLMRMRAFGFEMRPRKGSEAQLLGRYLQRYVP